MFLFNLDLINNPENLDDKYKKFICNHTLDVFQITATFYELIFRDPI